MQEAEKVEKPEEPDINDVFTNILLSEDRVVKDSYDEGYEIGRSQGNVEAFHLGYHRGAEIGVEIGYYSGVVESYLNYFKETDQEVDDKLLKNFTSLSNVLSTFPRYNDPEVDILDLLKQIRAKFKKVCAILKIHPEFPEPNPMSF